mmetsp:Transcript_14385/g.36772  ORF Transcript_14385/g.36772 Transcript_14385/m.36772 type:complete len:318 (+) Transcript_14385:85-1038(+)
MALTTGGLALPRSHVASPGARSDLSVIAAGLFAEDATTIGALREELQEARRLTAALREREATALVRASNAEAEVSKLREELTVMRSTAVRLSAHEASAREAAQNALLESRAQGHGMQARLEAMQLQQDLASRRRADRLQEQLVDAQKQLSKRIGANSGGWLRLLARRDNMSRLMQTFHCWYHDAFGKESKELWEMHVYYLGKQAEMHSRDSEKLVSKYGVALAELLGHQDKLAKSRSFRAWHRAASHQARVQETTVYSTHLRVLDDQRFKAASRCLGLLESCSRRQTLELALRAWLAAAPPGRTRSLARPAGFGVLG